MRRHGTCIDERQRGVDVLVAAICCAVIHKGNPALPETIWRRGNKSARARTGGEDQGRAQGGQGRAEDLSAYSFGRSRAERPPRTTSFSSFLGSAALNLGPAHQPHRHRVSCQSVSMSYRLPQVRDLALPLSAARAFLREVVPRMNAPQPSHRWELAAMPSKAARMNGFCIGNVCSEHANRRVLLACNAPRLTGVFCRRNR